MNKQIWAGRIISWLAVFFLLVDGVMKLFKPAPVVEATLRLGYPESTITGLGLVLISCTAFYLFPRTEVLGAILITGYLGGAVAAHVRAGSGGFEVFFPVMVGTLIWCGLWLRYKRLRDLLPFGSAQDA